MVCFLVEIGGYMNLFCHYFVDHRIVYASAVIQEVD